MSLFLDPDNPFAPTDTPRQPNRTFPATNIDYKRAWEDLADLIDESTTPVGPSLQSVLKLLPRGAAATIPKLQTQSVPRSEHPKEFVAGSSSVFTSPSKRRHHTLPPRSPKKKRRSPRSNDQKIAFFFKVLKKELNWGLSELLYYLFRLKDPKVKGPVRRSHKHAVQVSAFMRGQSKQFKPADMLEVFMRSKDGNADSPADMYSLTTDFRDIARAKPAVTSFAVQIALQIFLREQNKAVQPASGLQLSRTKRAIRSGRNFDQIDDKFIPDTTDLLRRHQPVTFAFLCVLASPKDSSSPLWGRGPARDGSRPPDLVVTQVLSMLNYSHNHFANRLSLATGVLFFGSSVSMNVWRYYSRVGASTAYSTTTSLLRSTGRENLNEVTLAGRDPALALVLRSDNVQLRHQIRDARLGRENRFLHGMSALVAVAPLPPGKPHILDVSRRRLLICEGKREDVTIETLFQIINWEHMDTIVELHWTLVPILLTPELAYMRSDIMSSFRNEGALRRETATRRTQLWTLATSGKNETVLNELAEAFFDFFGQMGITTDKKLLRSLFSGGDGLTFEKSLQLKNILTHMNDADTEDTLASMECFEPFLETWHTGKTDLARIFETHWGEENNRDPSTLGHSAAKINIKKPSNLSNIDYYPGTHLIDTVLKARIMDCWRIMYGCEDIYKHFAMLKEQDKLPTYADFRARAKEGHHRWTHLRAYSNVLDGFDDTRKFGAVPRGSPWVPPPAPASGSSDSAATGSVEPPAGSSSEPKFIGDRALAQSMRFMLDAILSQEVQMAVADGDIGRVWNTFKFWIFTFSGSRHAKYPKYLMEMAVSLELESDEDLRNFFLDNWLVNPSGLPGKTVEGDLSLEHVNDETKDVINRRDVEFGDKFVRETVSPNIFLLTGTPTNPYPSRTSTSTRKPPLDSLPIRPDSNIREYWQSILPRIPEDDRRAQLHTRICEYSEDVRNSLVGNYIAWGSHVVSHGTQSHSLDLRYIFWGRIVSYHHKVRQPYPEIIPGLYVDEYVFVTPQSLAAPFPTLYRSPSSFPSLKNTKT